MAMASRLVSDPAKAWCRGGFRKVSLGERVCAELAREPLPRGSRATALQPRSSEQESGKSRACIGAVEETVEIVADLLVTAGKLNLGGVGPPATSVLKRAPRAGWKRTLVRSSGSACKLGSGLHAAALHACLEEIGAADLMSEEARFGRAQASGGFKARRLDRICSEARDTQCTQGRTDSDESSRGEPRSSTRSHSEGIDK